MRHHNHFRVVTVVAVVALLSQVSLGIIRTPVNIPELAGQSTHILVGRVTAVQNAGSKVTVAVDGIPLQVQPVLATTQVVRVLKGSIAKSTITIRFFVPDEEIGYEPLGVNRLASFFLSGESNGVYELTNPRYPFFPAVEGPPQSLGIGALDKVFAELRGVIVNSNATIEIREDAVLLLGETLNYPGAATATNILRQVALDANSPVCLEAAANLLIHKDHTAIVPICSALQSPELLEEGKVIQLSRALHNGVDDPNVVAHVAPLLYSSNIEVRRGAVGALRNIETPDVVPHLAAALDDSDQEVRYDAMIGIASYAAQTGDHDGMAPDFDTFTVNEGQYIEYWRAWVQSR